MTTYRNHHEAAQLVAAIAGHFTVDWRTKARGNGQLDEPAEVALIDRIATEAIKGQEPPYDALLIEWFALKELRHAGYVVW